MAAVVAVVAGGDVAGEAADECRAGCSRRTRASVIRSRDYVFVQGVQASPLTQWARERPARGGHQRRYPHNLILEYGTEQGIPAVVLFVFCVAAWLSLLRTHVRRTPEAAIVGALLILYGVEALVSFGPNESRPLWFALGLALALPHFRTDR